MPIRKNYKDKFAYDIHKDVLRKGELWDTDAINQSIEMILGTYYGERLFNPSFGSPLTLTLFNNLTESNGENLLDELINSIKKWEDRITILENKCKMVLKPDDNAIVLTIPYYINKNGLTSLFEKKIIL